MILNVVGMSPEEFFAQLYPPHAGSPYSAMPAQSDLRADFDRLTAKIRGLVSLLQGQLFFTADQLADAVAAARREPL